MSIDGKRSVSINMVVHNGEGFIRYSLDSLEKQTFRDFEVNILDNASNDDTRKIIKQKYPQFNLIENDENIGFWAGQDKLLAQSGGEYILAMTDVVLKEDFLEKAVLAMEKDKSIGALEPKIYQVNLYNSDVPKFTNIIDTVGFKIFRSRRLINEGHGENDGPEFDKAKEIFAVEGAAPFFRKEVLEDIKVDGLITDPDFRNGPLGYGDDIDLAWRMRLFGWKQIYEPSVICWHDRSTTKRLARGKIDFIKIRQEIPIMKRRLDWRNNLLTLVKNDFAANFFRDSPFILFRQFRLWGYFVFFEPAMFLEIFNIAKLLPRMLKKRRQIMAKSKVSSKEMRKWFS